MAAFVSCGVVALDNGVGRVPPMGWSAWQSHNRFIDETIMEESIDAMARFRPFGYEFVNLDDGWADFERDGDTGRLVGNRSTFPHGIKALADRAHALDLKFGLYTAYGNQTCLKRPGSMGHEALDARTFAEWGIDYLKSDMCPGLAPENLSTWAAYALMRDGLNATGRPVYYVICPLWGISAAEANSTSSCGREVGASAYHVDHDGWRARTKELANGWFTEWVNNNNRFYRSWNGWSGCDGWVTIFDAALDLSDATWSGPGAFADLDAMSIGCNNGTGNATNARAHTDCANGLQTAQEQRSQFSLWSMMSARLVFGGDPRYIRAEGDSSPIWEILTNREVIALNQDAAAAPAVAAAFFPDAFDRTVTVLVKRLSDSWKKTDAPEGTTGPDGFVYRDEMYAPRALSLFNRGDAPLNVTVVRSMLDVARDDCAKVSLRDLWHHTMIVQDCYGAGAIWQVEVQPHEARVLRAFCE